MRRRSLAVGLFGGIVVSLVAVVTTVSMGLSFDRADPPVGHTPTPSDPGAPDDDPRPAPTPELSSSIPDEFHGGWVEAEGTTFTYVAGGPDPSNDKVLESSEWYRLDASGETIEYYAQFRRAGELVQVIWETSEHSTLWTREPVLPRAGGSSVCLMETQGSTELVRDRTIPFTTIDAIQGVGFSRPDEPSLMSDTAVMQLQSLSYETLFARSVNDVTQVLAVDRNGLAVFDYSAVAVDDVLMSERFRAIASVESRATGPTIEMERLCRELS